MFASSRRRATGVVKSDAANRLYANRRSRVISESGWGLSVTAERRAAIVRLLEALTDGLPVPVRAPMSTLGFVHSSVARESCADCLANGFVSRDCETCEGRGWVEERRERDPYDQSAATGSEGWFASSAAKHQRDRERVVEIGRLGEQLAPPRPEAELVAGIRPERWEVERRRLRAAFDVELLELALADLAAADVDAYRAVHAVHVYGWLPDAGAAAVCVERAIVFVSERLPERLRAPAVASAADQLGPMTLEQRNREMRRLSRDGAATQWIAARFGLSVAQVNRVLAGRDEAAAA
jgi:hypothetical protein